MKKALIIDDEADARSTLASFVGKYCPGLSLAGEAGSVQEALTLLNSREADLVFLDIRMNDGTGFDLLDKLREKKFDVIFTTAFEEYALKAFRYSAVDYLLKPIDPDELTAAVHKVTAAGSGIQVSREKLSVLSYNLNNQAAPRLAIADQKGISFISVADIIYCRSNNNYTVFYLAGKEQLVATKTLKDFEEMLSPLSFCRIHQTCLVNMDHIRRYIRGEGGVVVMSDNAELEVSRRKKAELIERLGKH